MNTADHTSEFDPKDIESNKVMGVLAYLGWLVLIPLLAASQSKYARFHSNQGIVLAIAATVVSIIAGILSLIPVVGWILGLLFWIVDAAIFVLVILGIVNAASGKAKDLPIIGKFRLLK